MTNKWISHMNMDTDQGKSILVINNVHMF